MFFQRLLKEQQKPVLLDDMKKFKNIFMALENACIHTYLMSGFRTFIFTKLEVVIHLSPVVQVVFPNSEGLKCTIAIVLIQMMVNYLA